MPRAKGTRLAQPSKTGRSYASRIAHSNKKDPALVKANYLKHYSDGRTSGEAAIKAGVSLMTVHRWCKSDPEFKAAYDEAFNAFTAHLESHGEKLAKTSTVKSAQMLMFMLRARNRPMYGDPKHEININNNVVTLTDERRNELREELRRELGIAPLATAEDSKRAITNR